ncbi:MAG: hypothetical protein HY515_00980, partial [Candidatus Aenigmarchaeota archaeon]|nr:hypothetical protein [Candidatus Aenigmarchaeota archaeon]
MSIDEEMRKARERDPANPNAGPVNTGVPNYGELYNETAGDLAAVASGLFNRENNAVATLMFPAHLILTPEKVPAATPDANTMVLSVTFPRTIPKQVYLQLLNGMHPYLAETDFVKVEDEVPLDEIERILGINFDYLRQGDRLDIRKYKRTDDKKTYCMPVAVHP